MKLFPNIFNDLEKRKNIHLTYYPGLSSVDTAEKYFDYSRSEGFIFEFKYEEFFVSFYKEDKNNSNLFCSIFYLNEIIHNYNSFHETKILSISEDAIIICDKYLKLKAFI